MDNNFTTSETRKKEDTGEKQFRKPNGKVWSAIPGFIFLSGAISSLQHIAKHFADDVDQIILIANWLPWIAVLFFAVGWFITHWIETALLKKRSRTAILLFIVFLIGSVFISSYFQFFINNDVLQSFGTTSLFLLFSGHSLRYSTFRNESVFLVQDLIPRRKS